MHTPNISTGYPMKHRISHLFFALLVLTTSISMTGSARIPRLVMPGSFLQKTSTWWQRRSPLVRCCVYSAITATVIFGIWNTLRTPNTLIRFRATPDIISPTPLPESTETRSFILHKRYLKTMEDEQARKQQQEQDQYDDKLLRAAECGHTSEVIQLLDHGADVNTSGTDTELLTNTFKTPLHQAALNGHLQTVQTLVDRNADVNARTSKETDSFTPLMFAMAYGYTNIAQYLQTQHAEFTTTDQSTLKTFVQQNTNPDNLKKCAAIAITPPYMAPAIAMPITVISQPHAKALRSCLKGARKQTREQNR